MQASPTIHGRISNLAKTFEIRQHSNSNSNFITSLLRCISIMQKLQFLEKYLSGIGKLKRHIPVAVCGFVQTQGRRSKAYMRSRARDVETQHYKTSTTLLLHHSCTSHALHNKHNTWLLTSLLSGTLSNLSHHSLKSELTFKVTQGHVLRGHWKGDEVLITLYNNAGFFTSKASKEIASEGTENAVFDNPTVVWHLSSGNPCEYAHKSYTARNLPETRVIALHLCCW